MRPDSLAIHFGRRVRESLEHQSPDNLAVFDDEWHLPAADLQHGAGTPAPAGLMAESWIEESCIMHPEFADERIKRHHFRREIRRNRNRLARSQNVKLVGIEDN